MIHELRQALQQVRDDISSGHSLDVGHVGALMQRIQESVGNIPERDAEILHTDLKETIAFVTDRQDLIAKELRQIRDSRKALKGYDHIRGHRTEQKLSRTA